MTLPLTPALGTADGAHWNGGPGAGAPRHGDRRPARPDRARRPRGAHAAPELPILIRTRFADGRETLTDPIVAEEETGIAHLVAGVLGRYEVAPEHIRRHAETGLLDGEDQSGRQ